MLILQRVVNYFCILFFSVSTTAFAIANPQEQVKSENAVPANVTHSNLQELPTIQKYQQQLWLPTAEIQLLIDQGKWQEAINAMLAVQPQYENDANYFNALGVLYLKNKSYLQAASAFERVVLLQSDNAGAWLDLAIANSEAGNFNQALSYFEYIEASLPPPPSVQTIITNYKKRIQRAKKLLAPWQSSAEAYLGYDTNANSGLLNNQIRVTYQGAEIDLELDKTYQPRADLYRQLILNTRYQNVWSGKRIDFYLGAQQRAFFKEHAYSFVDVSSNLSLQKMTDYGDYGVAVGAQQFILANKALLNNYTLAFNGERNLSNCRLNYGIEAEARRYKVASSLNGNTLWLQLANTCQFSHFAIPMQASIVVKKGDDHPIGFRAGGKTDREEMMLRLSAKVGQQSRIDMSFNMSKAKDSEGYSILLDNNAIRKTLRRSIRLQLNISLLEDLMMVVGVENNTIQSNLSLFRQKGQVINIGIQKQF